MEVICTFALPFHTPLSHNLPSWLRPDYAAEFALIKVTTDLHVAGSSGHVLVFLFLVFLGQY